MYDVIVLGKGPAGITGAIYAARGKQKVLIIGDKSNLEKAHIIDNYYGFPGGISGVELMERGIQQAKDLNIEIINDMVVSIEYINDEFKVHTKESQFSSKAVLLATGRTLNKIRIQNIEKFEGKGVHYCVTCDGFFYNGLNVGILGFTDYAVHELKELSHFSDDISLFTNGNELQISEQNLKYLQDNNIKINNKRIMKLDGEDAISSIIFEDDSMTSIDGIFIAYGSASSVDFARKLGVFTNKDAIVVDKEGRTNIPGLYAAGDCTGGFKQISVAVGQGAIAGQNIVEYIRTLGK